MAQRIDDAMVDVITKMNGITEHLRVHNFVDSANKIARNVHEVISIFTDAVVKLSEDQMVICDGRKIASNTKPPEPRNTEQVPKQNGHNMVLYSDVARQTPGPTVVQGPIRAAHGVGTRQTPAVTYRAPNTLGLTATIPSQINPVVPVGHPPVRESSEEKGAILTLSGAFGPHSLNFLTSKIRDGPLYSIEINYVQGFAEITFQKAAHALAFLEQERIKRARTGSGMFGAGFKIICASEVAWDDAFRKMEDKPRERRRLTLARAGLLGGNLSVKKILNDMGQIVGADAVEFIWAFNAGNVTAVFKSVATARAVRDHIMVMASHEDNAYFEVQVTFSTDPCERQLNLESQFGIPQHRRNLMRRNVKK
ncbi:hypothetical protein LOZ65_005880 [Ophidiomyces ophidiicola]|nr:hypothetical protein LOZ65_005880 [Ophidiomyces ophidiicola]